MPATRVSCGTVTVPENPGNRDGRRIALNVVIVRSAKRPAQSIPMFYLDGGPGVPATGAADFFLGPGGMYGRSRDIVLIDQRGTGGSNALTCPDQASRQVWDDEYRPDAVAACRRALESRADLVQYSTENAATDVDAVRHALRYERIDISALSYGTELAQAYLKRYPTRVHAAVLAGFVPLDLRQPLFHANNGQRVLDLLFYQCARDAACRSRYPRLREDWANVTHRLESGALAVQTKERTIMLDLLPTTRAPPRPLPKVCIFPSSAPRRSPAFLPTSRLSRAAHFSGRTGSIRSAPPARNGRVIRSPRLSTRHRRIECR